MALPAGVAGPEGLSATELGDGLPLARGTAEGEGTECRRRRVCMAVAGGEAAPLPLCAAAAWVRLWAGWRD